MFSDLPIWLSLLFVAGGLALLAWSSDFFVAGAASLARSLGVAPFIVGMVVIGFGTSAPELCVSALSGASGHSSLSLGNAYGSCVFNIAAILGIAAVLRPVAVRRSSAVASGLVLAVISACSYLLLRDGECSRTDGALLLVAFAVVMGAYCALGGRPAAQEDDAATDSGHVSAAVAALKTVVGLAVLAGSSHILVWGAVDLARAMGVGELAIGLTIVAAGTSLPELASAVAAARRGESDFVVGNIVGSNIFNTLAVVGLACTILPARGFSALVLARDIPAMAALSLSIALFAAFPGRAGGAVACAGTPATVRIGRAKGVLWLFAFAAYEALVVVQEIF